MYEWLGPALESLSGIEPGEVNQVLAAARRWPRPALGENNLSVLTIWGRTRSGRPLIVAVRHQAGWGWLIVGARTMTSKELTRFETWEATR